MSIHRCPTNATNVDSESEGTPLCRENSKVFNFTWMWTCGYNKKKLLGSFSASFSRVSGGNSPIWQHAFWLTSLKLRPLVVGSVVVAVPRPIDTKPGSSPWRIYEKLWRLYITYWIYIYIYILDIYIYIYWIDIYVYIYILDRYICIYIYIG